MPSTSNRSWMALAAVVLGLAIPFGLQKARDFQRRDETTSGSMERPSLPCEGLDCPGYVPPHTRTLGSLLGLAGSGGAAGSTGAVVTSSAIATATPRRPAPATTSDETWGGSPAPPSSVQVAPPARRIDTLSALGAVIASAEAARSAAPIASSSASATASAEPAASASASARPAPQQREEPPVPCGTITCPAGQVCCNPDCEICTAPGETCSQVACNTGQLPVSLQCGPNTCNVGEVCCNLSCGICTLPGQPCSQERCDNVQTPSSMPCGMNTCNVGEICCNPSCGTCVQPGETCSPEPCG